MTRGFLSRLFGSPWKFRRAFSDLRITGGIGRRIVAINIVCLLIFFVGVIFLDQTRDRLIDFRIRDLESHGRIVAQSIADTADPDAEMPSYDRKEANRLLQKIELPTPIRIRIYDLDANLTGDTRSLQGDAAAIRQSELATDWSDPETLLDRFADTIDWLRRSGHPEPPLYIEAPTSGVATEEEVFLALEGRVDATIRANSAGETVVSVAVPVQQLKVIMGALVLSTEGGDIDGIVREERKQLLRITALALLVSIILSYLLARFIARPLRALARTARSVKIRGTSMPRMEGSSWPMLSTRKDEIGLLAGALQHMTGSLYDRIIATESFAADVAHELKNPLMSLRSAVEAFRQAKSPETRERLLQVIESDSIRLDMLVTDISNASRLDAELAREEIVRFDLREPARVVCELSGDSAESREVQVLADLPEEPVWVSGIENRIAQVLDNLVSNAISFSPDGGTVILCIERRPRTRVVVEDEGPGIPNDQLENVFERFHTYRPDAEFFGRHSGLGLSISRQIIESFDGRIWAENRDDRISGARLIVEFEE